MYCSENTATESIWTERNEKRGETKTMIGEWRT